MLWRSRREDTVLSKCGRGASTEDEKAGAVETGETAGGFSPEIAIGRELHGLHRLFGKTIQYMPDMLRLLKASTVEGQHCRRTK